MKDLLESLLISLLICLIILAITNGVIYILTKYEHEKDINVYNNGICECGGNYEFINKTRGSIHMEEYVFQCDSCNKIIEFMTNPLE